MTEDVVTERNRTETPAEIVSLFRDEAALYAKLEAYAERQRLLIAEEDTTPLLALLADRQKLSTALAVVGARLAPVRREWESWQVRLSADQRHEVERLARGTEECLRRVIDRDEQDARMLSARKQTAAQGMRTTHDAGAAISAYRTPVPSGERSGRLDEAT
jgi:hypothetical protein